MDPRTMLIAGKLTGKLPIVLAAGHVDIVGRFHPDVQADVVASLEPVGSYWVAESQMTQVTYTSERPRVLTHIGAFIVGRWIIVRVGSITGRAPTAVCPDDIVTIPPTKFILPETQEWES